MTRRFPMICTAAILLVFVSGMVWWSTKGPSKKSEEPPRPGRAENPNYAKCLTDAGWEDQAAQAVAELNREWFQIQAEENPNGLNRQLKLLAELGKHPTLQRFIAEHPETAGLLATSEDPEQMVDGLDSDTDEYPLVAAVYVRHAAPADASDVAVALKRNRDLIVALQRRGLIGCEVLFLFERQDPSTEVYESWLRDAVEAKSAGSDVEFASFVNLVMRHGRPIRQRLRDDETFRSHFRDELWPRLQRAADEHGAFELYLDEDRIWDLVELDNGEELLKRCGLLAIDLLYGYPEIDHLPYPQPLRGKVVQVLLRREVSLGA